MVPRTDMQRNREKPRDPANPAATREAETGERDIETQEPVTEGKTLEYQDIQSGQ